MQALLFGDLHGDPDAARRLATRLKQVEYGFCLGDIVSFGSGVAEALALLDVGTELYVLPGNHETEDDMRRGCAEHPHFHFFHGQYVTLGTTTFAGLGGGVEARFGMPFELPEEKATSLLRGFSTLPNLVLISHTPPYDTTVDLARGDQHIGARSIRSFILKAKPVAVYSGHVHEAEGKSDSLGSTRLRAVGRLGYTIDI
jgi:Icc-related predicted phosphoesterase